MKAYKKGDDPRFVTEWVAEGDHQFMCGCCGQMVHADELVAVTA